MSRNNIPNDIAFDRLVLLSEGRGCDPVPLAVIRTSNPQYFSNTGWLQGMRKLQPGETYELHLTHDELVDRLKPAVPIRRDRKPMLPVLQLAYDAMANCKDESKLPVIDDPEPRIIKIQGIQQGPHLLP